VFVIFLIFLSCFDQTKDKVSFFKKKGCSSTIHTIYSLAMQMCDPNSDDEFSDHSPSPNGRQGLSEKMKSSQFVWNSFMPSTNDEVRNQWELGEFESSQMKMNDDHGEVRNDDSDNKCMT
jgi:hypothetical protein